MWQNVTDVIRENVQIGCISNEKLIKQDIRKVDNTKLINYFDKNRMEQLNTFIELKDKMKNADVDTLECYIPYIQQKDIISKIDF